MVAVTRAVSGHPTTNAFALTPDRLGHAKVWLFATSALIVNGPVVVQLALLVPTLYMAVRRLGPALTLGVMVGAHVGATLLAYGALALFTGDADGAHNRQLDYGVSAVWMGALGALWALWLLALVRAHRREPYAIAVVLGGFCVFVIGAVAFPLLADTEHALAFALGAGAAALLGHGAQARVGRFDAPHPRRAHQLRGADG